MKHDNQKQLKQVANAAIAVDELLLTMSWKEDEKNAKEAFAIFYAHFGNYLYLVCEKAFYKYRHWYNATLIDFLFNKREKSISYENLLNYLDDNQDRIQILLEKAILNMTGNSIELDSRIKDFFENFADTKKEINIEYTDYLIKSLNDKLFLYEEEKRLTKKDEYAHKIKSTIREIAKNIIKNINIIRNSIEDVYASEKNFKIGN